MPLRDFMPYFFGRSLIGTHNAGDRKEVRTKKISIRHTDLIQGEDKRFLDDFLKPVLSSLDVRYDYSIKYLTSFVIFLTLSTLMIANVNFEPIITGLKSYTG